MGPLVSRKGSPGVEGPERPPKVTLQDQSVVPAVQPLDAEMCLT